MGISGKRLHEWVIHFFCTIRDAARRRPACRGFIFFQTKACPDWIIGWSDHRFPRDIPTSRCCSFSVTTLTSITIGLLKMTLDFLAIGTSFSILLKIQSRIFWLAMFVLMPMSRIGRGGRYIIRASRFRFLNVFVPSIRFIACRRHRCPFCTSL